MVGTARYGFYKCHWQVFRKAAPKQGRNLTWTNAVPSLFKGPLLNVDHSPVLNHSKRWGTSSSCWHNRKWACRCTSHSPRALLLFDTNYNVCFVRCPTLSTHTVHRCIHMETACSHKHVHAYILMHTLKHTLWGARLSLWNSPSHNSEETGLFPDVPSQPGMIQFPLWPTAHTTLSHPILSNRPIQLCIPTQTTCIPFVLNHNPNGIKEQLRNI